MKILRIIAAVVIAAAMLSGCGDEIPAPLVSEKQPEFDLPPAMPAYPVSFGDETFEASPESVVSLSPEITELLYEIGVGDRLLAVGEYCGYPESAAELTKVGSPAGPDVDGIVSLSPELLITQSPIAAPDLLVLRQAGVRVMELNTPKNFGEFCDLYVGLSNVFYGAADAPNVYNSALAEINNAMTEAFSLGVSGTFVIVEDYAEGGLMLSPKSSFCSDIFSLFGENIWSGEDYFATDEQLFEIGPDRVFYSDRLDRDDIEETFPHSELIPFDFERFESPSGRLAEEILGVVGRLSG